MLISTQKTSVKQVEEPSYRWSRDVKAAGGKPLFESANREISLASNIVSLSRWLAKFR
jgi:hypothetical protein